MLREIIQLLSLHPLTCLIHRFDQLICMVNRTDRLRRSINLRRSRSLVGNETSVLLGRFLRCTIKMRPILAQFIYRSALRELGAVIKEALKTLADL